MINAITVKYGISLPKGLQIRTTKRLGERKLQMRSKRPQNRAKHTMNEVEYGHLSGTERVRNPTGQSTGAKMRKPTEAQTDVTTHASSTRTKNQAYNGDQ